MTGAAWIKTILPHANNKVLGHRQAEYTIGVDHQGQRMVGQGSRFWPLTQGHARPMFLNIP